MKSQEGFRKTLPIKKTEVKFYENDNEKVV